MSAPKTPEEVKQWINSEEYKELNFKREALVINPPKACQPLGAIFAALGFEGTLPYVHGSQGCVAYFRSSLSRHYREPVIAIADSMTEDAAVFGGLQNLRDGLNNCVALYKPKMIAMSTTCMAEVIGDDLNAFIGKAKSEGDIPQDFIVTYANTPSFVGSHVTGYDNMLRAILTQLTANKPRTKQTNRINIIPGFDPHIGNIREVKRLLDTMGVEYTVLADNADVLDSPLTGEFTMFPGGTPLEAVYDAPNAKATISLQKFSAIQTVKAIQEKWEDHEGLLLYPPMGIRATDKFLMEVSRITGKPIPESIEKERGRVVDAITDCHQYFHGKRFAIFGDQDTVFGMTNFILEMGGEPVHLLTATGSKQWQKEMNVLLESSPYGKEAKLYPKHDLWHLRSLLMTEKVDMLIGTAYGKWIARDADIPLVRIGHPTFDRVNLPRYSTIGYQGTLNLVTTISNTFLDDLDRKSPDERFEMMR